MEDNSNHRQQAVHTCYPDVAHPMWLIFVQNICPKLRGETLLVHLHVTCPRSHLGSGQDVTRLQLILALCKPTTYSLQLSDLVAGHLLHSKLCEFSLDALGSFQKLRGRLVYVHCKRRDRTHVHAVRMEQGFAAQKGSSLTEIPGTRPSCPVTTGYKAPQSSVP